MAQNVLITAFQPFPGVTENPTETLLRSLPTCRDHDLVRARHLLVPTSYADAPRELRGALESRTSALVMTGYSGQATGLVLERCATSARLPGRPDATGFCPPAAIEKPETMETAVDIGAIVARLTDAGLSACESRDAGSYVCNHLYFTALRALAETSPSVPALFVHFPALQGTDLAQTSAAAMALKDMQQALGIIVRSLIGDIAGHS